MVPAPDLARTGSGRCLLAALLFVLFRALPNISYPIGHDQATYCVIGEGLLRGQQLYRDLWDIKPPGIFWLFTLVVKVFGPVMWSVGLVDILWLLAISHFIFRFAERYLGTAAAVIAVLVNAAWHCRVGYVDAGQPECFLMLFVFAAYFAASGTGRWQVARQFAAGLCLGAAFWLKYNALAFFPLLALIPYLDWSRLDIRPRQVRLLIPWRSWCKRISVLLVGFSTTVALVLCYFWLAGSWSPFKEAQFEALPRYTTMALQGSPHYWAFAIGRTLAWVGLWTVLATGVSLLIAEKRALSRFVPVLAATAMGYAATASQFRFRHYAFETCYPFFAMVWGYLGVKIYEGARAMAQGSSGRRRQVVVVLAWALLANLLFWPARAEVKALAERYRDLTAWWRNPDGFYANYPAMQLDIEYLRGQMQVIHELRQESVPGDGVFVWGTDPLIYYLTQLRPPTRFVSNLALISPWAPPAWREELIRDLNGSLPAFIVVARRDQVPEIAFTQLDSEQYLTVFPQLADLISGSYRLMAAFPDFVIYRRKAPPGEEPFPLRRRPLNLP